MTKSMPLKRQTAAMNSAINLSAEQLHIKSGEVIKTALCNDLEAQ